MKKRFHFFPNNWLRAGVLIAFAASFSFNLQAQSAPVKIWDKAFGGSSHEQLNVLQKTSDGGYILGGTSTSSISGDKTQANQGYNDYWIVKLDSIGNKLWDKTYGGNSYDVLLAVQQTTDGGYIVGGQSYSGLSGDKTQNSRGDKDFWVLKLDGNGNKIWDRTFGGSMGDWLQSLQQTSDGGYILGGHSDSGISGDKTQPWIGGWDFWVVKLDAGGNKLWDKTFGGIDSDVLYSLCQTSDGGYFLGGYSNSGISGDKSQASKGAQDFWAIKLDSNGNKVWDKGFGGSKGEEIRSLKQTSDGGYILGGSSESGISGDKTHPSQGLVDYWIVKLDLYGNKLWDKTYGGDYSDFLWSLQQTSDKGFVLGGYSKSNLGGDKSEINKGGDDYWIVKLDSIGNKIWDKSLGGSGYELYCSIQSTSDGGYLIGGFSSSDSTGDKSQLSKGSFDFWVVKLGTKISGLKEALITKLSLYPNPTSGLLTLELQTSQPTEVTVLNALGQQMLQKTVGKTDEKVVLDLSKVAKGIYLVQVKTEKQVVVKKVVVE